MMPTHPRKRGRGTAWRAGPGQDGSCVMMDVSDMPMTGRASRELPLAGPHTDKIFAGSLIRLHGSTGFVRAARRGTRGPGQVPVWLLIRIRWWTPPAQGHMVTPAGTCRGQLGRASEISSGGARLPWPANRREEQPSLSRATASSADIPADLLFRRPAH